MISVDSILSDKHDLDKLDDLCRLCGQLKDSSSLIFDINRSNYDSIINSHFKDEFQILKTDVLPLKICNCCLASVESWNKFYISTVEVNEKFLLLIDKFGLTKESKKKPADMMNNDIEVIEVSVEGDNYEFFNEQDNVNEFDITNIKYTHEFVDSNQFGDLVDEDVGMNDCEDRIVEHTSEKDSPSEYETNASVQINSHEEQIKVTIDQTVDVDESPELDMSAAGALTHPQIPAEFQSFLKMHTNNIKYMQCDKCSFICRPLMTLFLKHYQKHVDFIETTHITRYILEFDKHDVPLVEEVEPANESKRYKCDRCPKSFNKRKNFTRHMKLHDKRVFPCNLCDRKFKTKMAFKKHKERHKRKKEFLTCDQCGKYFKSKDGYKYHRENKCIVSKCNLCDETFGQTSILKEHLKSSHDVAMSDTEEERRLEASTSMCFVCGKIVKDMNLERHMMVHMEEKPFVCELCGKSFKFKSAIRDHMMVKLGMKDYVCEICGRKFVKKCYLNKHIRLHCSKNDINNLQCDICSEQFTHKKAYLLHKRASHDVDKSFSCDLCDKSFNTKACLRQHVLREVICMLCDEIFTSNDLLKQHVIQFHNLIEYRKKVNDEVPSESAFVYPCDICGRKFTSEERYKQHLTTELTCQLCLSQFTKTEELRSHIEKEHDPVEHRKLMTLRWKQTIKRGDVKSEEYTCNLCGKKLFYKRTLLLHMRMHSGLKPFKCEYCGKAYTSKYSLKAHLVSEMNLRKYVCSYCGKRYNFNSDLVIHVKQRHESRQFSCHVCGKKFGLLKYLKDHSTVHSQTKPFNCEKCKVGFRLKKFLLRHNKKYHSHSGDDGQVFYIEVGADD